MTLPKPYYSRGPVRIYHGDCLEILPQLEAGSVDAVVTDPPYGVGFKYESHDDDESRYESLIVPVVSECVRLVTDGGGLFFWQGMRHADRFHRYFPAGYRIFAALKNFTQHLPTPLQHSWDPVVFWWNGKTKRRAICGQRDYHIGNTARWVSEKSNGHPCPRPEDTVEYVVSISTDSGQLILDPFFGSGTTAVACIRTGRKCIGIELEEKYCEIAAKRCDRELDQGRLFKPEPVKEVQKELAIA